LNRFIFTKNNIIALYMVVLVIGSTNSI